jgi:hypothetical protein
MSGTPVAVVDANALLSLATSVVDSRPMAPSGSDPLKALLTAYDIHVPASVFGGVTDATGERMYSPRPPTWCFGLPTIP